MPMTGVPFPFMSYGGSNLMTLSILVGIALNISAEEKRNALYKGLPITTPTNKQKQLVKKNA